MTVKIMKSGAMAVAGAVKVMKASVMTDAGFVKARKAGAWVIVWPIFALVGGTISTTSTTVAGATSRYTLTSAGLETKKNGAASAVTLGTYRQGGIAADYESRVTTVSLSGGSPSGAEGVWESLGTTREWTLAAITTATSESWAFTVEIRSASTLAVLATASVTLNSTRT